MTDLLFNDVTIHRYLDVRGRSLFAFVQNADSDLFKSKDGLRKLANKAVDELKLQVPELDMGCMTADNEELLLDGSYGMKIQLHLPFNGNAELLRVQPSTFTFNPPRGSVSGEELILDIAVPSSEVDTDSVKRYLQGTIGSISTYLHNLGGECSAWNTRLPDKARDLIDRRRSRLNLHSRVLEEIGIQRRRNRDSVTG